MGGKESLALQDGWEAVVGGVDPAAAPADEVPPAADGFPAPELLPACAAPQFLRSLPRSDLLRQLYCLHLVLLLIFPLFLRHFIHLPYSRYFTPFP